MLDGINRGATGALPVHPAPARIPSPGAALTIPQVSVLAACHEESVKISVSADAITAAVTSTTVVASAYLADSGGASAAEIEAQRGQQALGTITQAKGEAARTMKGFLRQKLEAYKKQLQILRILGTDPLEIARGGVKIARGVAGAARDYAAATLEERRAGISESAAATGTGAQAGDEAAALKAKADAAPLDSTGDTPADAPTDPDERFFYEACRILGLARKTLVQAQQVDTRVNGNDHAKEFKKLRKREADFETAVTGSYVALKTGGSLGEVDALLRDSDSGGATISTLV
ncbi:MAG: hypothetical protein WCO00_01455 [Rhodospirillaceae bacterium]